MSLTSRTTCIYGQIISDWSFVYSRASCKSHEPPPQGWWKKEEDEQFIFKYRAVVTFKMALWCWTEDWEDYPQPNDSVRWERDMFGSFLFLFTSLQPCRLREQYWNESDWEAAMYQNSNKKSRRRRICHRKKYPKALHNSSDIVKAKKFSKIPRKDVIVRVNVA